MATKKTFLLPLLCFCFAATALAEGAPDVYLKTQHLRDNDGTICRTGISPFRGNLAVMGRVGTGSPVQASIRIFDRANRKKNTFPLTNLGSVSALEVSDSGPGGFINIAFLRRDASSTVDHLLFSQDSGANFQELTLTTTPLYTKYYNGSFGGSGPDRGKNVMKFDANGRLHIFWFAGKSDNTTKYLLNHEVFNQDGTSYFYEVVGPSPPSYIPFVVSSARIHVVATDSKVVAITQKPSIGWWCADCGGPGLGQIKYDVPVAIVKDITNNATTQTIGIGAYTYSANQSNYNNFGGNFSANPLSSDGVNLYLINRTAPVAGSDNYQIRRFPPLPGDKFFPDCTPYGLHTSDGPLTNLEIMLAPDPRIETSSFWTKTDPNPANGAVYGFVSPRWRRNQPGWVDLIYKTPDQLASGVFYDFVQRRRFNPDVALSSQQALSRPIMLNDVMETTYLPPGTGAHNPMEIFPSAGVFDAISVEGGSAVSWCQNEAVGFDLVYRYFLQVMDIS